MPNEYVSKAQYKQKLRAPMGVIEPKQEDLSPAVKSALRRFKLALEVRTLQKDKADLGRTVQELRGALKIAKEFIENQQLADAKWSRVLDVCVKALR